jgi:hypothetical protein
VPDPEKLLISGAIEKPTERTFSLGITDNAGVKKNGAVLLTLKFGEGTPDAMTVIAEKGTPTIDGKDGDGGWGPISKAESKMGTNNPGDRSVSCHNVSKSTGPVLSQV